MLYRHTIDHCLPHIDKDDLSSTGFQPLLLQSSSVLAQLKEQREKGSNTLLGLPSRRDDLPAMQELAQHIRNTYSQLVILGTGGSTLNGQTLASLATPKTGATRLYFLDNVDPYSFDLFLSSIDIRTTAFLAISKSGKTVETLAQTLVCLQAAKKILGGNAGRHFFIISDPVDNPIRRLGLAIGATMLDHEPQIGGRFAAFTNVALIPALVAGLDAQAFRAGAESVIQAHCYASLPEMPEAAKGAALAIHLMQRGYRISVMMPYCDRLTVFSSWYRQIWAESLGKNGHGTTPVRALGTVDQHSQLQLYLDGPRDKIITLITLDNKGKGPLIEAPTQDPALSYIAGKTLGDLIAAEQQATADTLIRNGCPVRSFSLDVLNERSMGALLMHFMLETIVTAALLNINAYDQPAVEEGKILTRKLLEEAL